VGQQRRLGPGYCISWEALALRPVGHTDRSLSLNSLGNYLSTRFDHQGSDKDLDEAIALHREALDLRSLSHTYQSNSLNNLANQFSTRFAHQGNAETWIGLLHFTRKCWLYALLVTQIGSRH
jgi:hypothetical protein